MDFTQTKTYENLARGFAGECMAGMRYQFLADLATIQGYQTLSTELKQLAKNETFHAKKFMQYILKYGKEAQNVNISAGFPFDGETLQSGLYKAVISEKNEAERIYPEFALTAEREGFNDIRDTFNLIAKVETAHKEKFSYLNKSFNDGTLFKSDKKKLYVCTNCGHTFEDYESWKVCPLCDSTQGFVGIEYPQNNKNEKE